MNDCRLRVVAFFLGLAAAATTARAETLARERLAVVSQDAGSVTEIDPRSGEILRVVDVGKGPAAVAAAPDGATLYVSYPDGKGLGAVDVAHGTPVRHLPFDGEPFGIAADTGAVYVSDWSKNTVTKIDALTGTAVAVVDVGKSPAGLTLDEAGHRLYAADRESDDVTIIDTSAMRKILSVPVGKAPYVMALSPDGDRLYVADVRGNDISVIDTHRAERIATIGVGNMPYGVAVTPGGDTVLVTNQHGGTLSVIDARTLSVVATIPVGRYPEGVAATGDGRAYVANWFSGDVSIVDLSLRREIRRIKVGEGPRSFALVPVPSAIGTR